MKDGSSVLDFVFQQLTMRWRLELGSLSRLFVWLNCKTDNADFEDWTGLSAARRWRGSSRGRISEGIGGNGKGGLNCQFDAHDSGELAEVPLRRKEGGGDLIVSSLPQPLN